MARRVRHRRVGHWLTYGLAAALVSAPYLLDIPVIMSSIAALLVATLAVLGSAFFPQRDAWRILPRTPGSFEGAPLQAVLGRQKLKR